MPDFSYCLQDLLGKIASYLKSTPYPHAIHTFYVDFVPRNTFADCLNE